MRTKQPIIIPNAYHCHTPRHLIVMQKVDTLPRLFETFWGLNWLQYKPARGGKRRLQQRLQPSIPP